MLLIRIVENKISDNVRDGVIKCPAHLSIGQEATAVGIVDNLIDGDSAFGTHRGHAPYLAFDGNVYQLLAEVLGKNDGCSKGMGGSQHLFKAKPKYYASVPIVGATVPIAVGAALAAKLKKTNNVSVCFFGDGAVEEGTVQESMNLASKNKLPVIFVCENNLFASHMHILQRQPRKSVLRFAIAHNIEHNIVDGNDVVSINKVGKKAIENARSGNGPFFIEAVTYRWKGHVGHREDMDVGVKRKEEWILWKKRDPIFRLEQALVNNKLSSLEEIKLFKSETSKFINNLWEKALKAPYPTLNSLEDLVYFSNPKRENKNVK